MEELSKLQELSFEIIGHAGEAKTFAFDALNAAKNNDRNTFEQKISEAESAINDAHRIQFQLLQLENSGELETDKFSIIAVHGQDHLMTVMTQIEVFKEIGEMYLLFGNK